MSWRTVVITGNAKLDYKMDYMVVRKANIIRNRGKFLWKINRFFEDRYVFCSRLQRVSKWEGLWIFTGMGKVSRNYISIGRIWWNQLPSGINKYIINRDGCVIH